MNVHFTGVYLMGVHFMGVHHRMQLFYLSRTYVFAAFGNLALGPIAPGRSHYPQYLRAQMHDHGGDANGPRRGRRYATTAEAQMNHDGGAVAGAHTGVCAGATLTLAYTRR